MKKIQKQLASEAEASPKTDSYRHSNVTRMEIEGMAGMGRNNGPQMGVTIDMDGFQQGLRFPDGSKRKPTESYIVLSHRQARWLRDRISEIIG